MKTKRYFSFALLLFSTSSFADTAVAIASMKVYSAVEMVKEKSLSKRVGLGVDTIRVSPNQMLIMQQNGRAITISSGSSGRIKAPVSNSIEYFF